MAIIECSTEIKSTQAFHAAQNYALRKRWDPFAARLEREETFDGRQIVTVTAWHGATMQVEFVAWLPPERAAIRMVCGPCMLQTFAGSWAFLDRGGDRIEARFRYQLKAAPAWIGLERLMRLYFSWETRRRLQALKRYLESTTDEQAN